MFEDLKLPVEFHKEKIHVEEEKEILKDGDKWYLVAGNLILASITYKKYINFSRYIVKFTEFGIDKSAMPYPNKWKDKKTLEEAKEAIKSRLKVCDG